MRPADVLDKHLDMLSHFEDSHGFLKRLIANTYISNYTLDDDDAAGPEMANVVGEHVRAAETYVIEPTMIDEIIISAVTMFDENTEIGDCVGPPSSAGFMYLPRPIESIEARGRQTLTHAAVWGNVVDPRGVRGLLVALFNDLDRQPDEVMAETVNQMKRDGLFHILGPWSPSMVYVLPYFIKVGPPFLPFEKIEGVEPPTDYGSLNMLRVIFAIWALMNETISVGEPIQTQHASRAAARRAKRVNIKPTVRVVTLRRLRRPTQNPGSGQPLKWRSTVKEHYRNQAWGPGRQLRRRILIEEHARGPEDAPPCPNTRGRVTRLTR